MKALVGYVGVMFLSIYSTRAAAQLNPYLPGADATGMGGIAATLPSNDAMAQLANPAQAGFFSLNGITSFGTNILSPSFMTYAGNGSGNVSPFSSAIEFGANLSGLFKSPLRISMGVGLARTNIENSGTFEVGSYLENDGSNSITLGLGLEDQLKLGVGVGFKWMSSSVLTNYPGGNMKGSVNSYDYGAIVQVPLEQIIFGWNTENFSEDGLFYLPIADLTAGYAMQDVGGYLKYNYGVPEILPRQGDLGISIDLGLESGFDGRPWKIFSVTLAREADESLVKLDSSVSVYQGNITYDYFNAYISAIREMSPYNDLIRGVAGGEVGVRSGLQFEVGECAYLRFGSMSGSVLASYKTFGFGFRLEGFMRVLSVIENDTSPHSFLMSILLNHLDVRYDYATFTDWRGGPVFNELIVLVR